MITKKTPLISVIIPTYNLSLYLRRAVDSVLSQDVDDMEVIVVDDFSMDDTVEMMNTFYKDNDFVKLVCHNENKSLGASRNTGLDVAKGKYVFFLDADDWLESGAFSHILSVAEKNNADVVACGVNKVFDDAKTSLFHSYSFKCTGGRDGLAKFANHNIGSIAWNKLYLREFIENNKLRFVVKYYHEDVIFSANMAYLCKNYISIPDAYYNYFQRSGSMVNSVPKLLHLESYFRLYKDMIDFIERINLCNDDDGEALCKRLLCMHCAWELTPKLWKYIKTRSNEEWVSQCTVACRNVFGVKGFAIADFLTHMFDNGKCSLK